MSTRVQGVYAIVNVNNGHRYVGSSYNIHGRYREHLLALTKGTHHSFILQRAWAKHGAGVFELSVLEQVETRDMLIAREQWHIDQTPAGESYNTSIDASSSMGGRRHTEETKAVIRAKRKLQQMTPAMLAALRLGRHGHEYSQESRAKMSASAKKRAIQGRTGHLHTVETKSKLSELARARMTPEMRAHLSVMNTGRQPSEETRAKIVAAAKSRNNWPSPTAETRKKISESLSGRVRGPLSPEVRAKISATKTPEIRAAVGNKLRAHWLAIKETRHDTLIGVWDMCG